MTKVLPNFMVAGMAKCGTSSLASYLSQHPDIFISEKKEPRFFTSQNEEIYPLNGPKDDEVMAWYVTDYADYCGLFENASEKAVGEASADTLYFHKYTIPLIKEHLGDPKIILIIRNPIKRAVSAFQYLKRYEREPVSFEESLEKEPERIRDNWELIYHLKNVGLYYEPVKAFMDNFTDVKVFLSEDLSKNAGSVLRESFDFLGVDSGFQVDTSTRFNPSGIPKNRLFHNFLEKESLLRKALRPFIRLVFRQQGMRKKISTQLMAKNFDKLSLNPTTETMLKDFFREDTIKTSELIGKDLSHWVN